MAFFATLLFSAGVLVASEGVVSWQISRDGVPPGRSWALSIAQHTDTDMTSANREIAAILAESDGLVRYAAEFGLFRGAPALAVYDSSASPLPTMPVAGRWFNSSEMTGEETAMLVREGSYLLRDVGLGADAPILPDWGIIGHFPVGYPSAFEFVVPAVAWNPPVLPHTIYLQADEATANEVLAVIVQYADATVSGPESLRARLSSEILFLVMLAGGVLAVTTVVLGVIDSVIAEKPRWRIERLLGASRFAAGFRQAARVTLSGLIGAVLSTLLVGLLLPLAGATPPRWQWLTLIAPPLLVTGMAFLAGIATAGFQRLRYREWV